MAAIYFPTFDNPGSIQIGGESRDPGGYRLPIIENILIHATGSVKSRGVEVLNVNSPTWKVEVILSEEKKPIEVMATKEVLLQDGCRANTVISISESGELNNGAIVYSITVTTNYFSIDNKVRFHFFQELRYVPFESTLVELVQSYNGRRIVKFGNYYNIKGFLKTPPNEMDVFYAVDNSLINITESGYSVFPDKPEEKELFGVMVKTVRTALVVTMLRLYISVDQDYSKSKDLNKVWLNLANLDIEGLFSSSFYMSPKSITPT